MIITSLLTTLDTQGKLNWFFHFNTPYPENLLEQHFKHYIIIDLRMTFTRHVNPHDSLLILNDIITLYNCINVATAADSIEITFETNFECVQEKHYLPVIYN